MPQFDLIKPKLAHLTLSCANKHQTTNKKRQQDKKTTKIIPYH